MKILFLTGSISAGGAELHLLTLARYLKKQNIEIKIACLRDPVKGFRSIRADFEQEGFEVIDLDGDNRYDLRVLPRLVSLLKSDPPDILHTHLPRADILGTAARHFAQVPVLISSVHGLYRDRWFGRWAFPLMAWSYHQADQVIAISHAVKDWLVHDFRLNSDKVKVIYYGIETDKFIEVSQELKKAGKSNGDLRLGCLGRLEPGKGYEFLIKAIPAVLNKFPNTIVLIAGHDPWGHGKHLQLLINGIGVDDHVRLMGFNKDIPGYLKSLDIFVFTSLSEGFGQVIIEAMASGLPVIAWRIPPMTEIIIDQQTGLLVDFMDINQLSRAIIWLFEHPERGVKMGEAGQRRVIEYFNASRMSREVVNLYEVLLSEKNYPSIGCARRETT